MPFPTDFLWGAATASYQIEGAALQDGRSECIWTHFSHTPGKVENGDTGDVACDHYHLYKNDVALMKELCLQSYRFSISWARVIPSGIGKVNDIGLGFYDRLVDELLQVGIKPWATLYHWDLPQILQDKGGWANPESPKWFADYTDVVTNQLGDRIQGWITFNEPWCIAALGNLLGIHAPGLTDPVVTFRVAHHLLLAHGAAMPLIRNNSPKAQAGMTLNLAANIPATDREEDILLAKQQDGFSNYWFLEPLYRGHYPSDVIEHVRPSLDGIDLGSVCAAMVPTDFLGINYYNRQIIKHDVVPGENVYPTTSEFTDMNWEVFPPALTDLLIRVNQEYHPPAVYITENGAAFADPLPISDVVEDPRRVAFIKGYLGAIESAIARGVPVKGYFVWSLMDNFEWAFGYAKRFGIIHVDFATQKRTFKRSAHYYRSVIQNNSI